MIDLYHRLGVSGPSDSAGVWRAMRSTEVDEETKRLAAFVLGDPSRSQVHDAAWRTVSTVARLRANFLLEATPLWTRSRAREFGLSASGDRRMAECLPVSVTRRQRVTT
jgi:hypothetical protein